MTMAADALSLITIWGATWTIVRRAASYGDTGKPTVTWSTIGTYLAFMQPVSEVVSRKEVGIEKKGTHRFFFPDGTGVLEGDRLRPAGWAAGNDEYEVGDVEAQVPSHVEVSAVMVKGHGG